MSDENRKDGGAPAPNETTVAQEAAALEERLATAEAEAAEVKDRLLRALADTENLRRRAQREREEATRFAASGFAKELVNVADNLRRALESLPEDQVQDERTRNLLAGVAATERELLAIFDRHGIRRVAPQPGDRFDHNLHQAMFEVENSGQPAGSIAQVLQPGYTMHDRLLRPAMVGVAKASSRPGDPPQRIDTVV